ncbi:transmembrane protein, putative [Bodo saltans]|uniref:Transmembrane protein, putative n=1 Tax=Bodo saltans TaxID=75058 RepID=A0A0S4IIF4_BODSA|nr:transmembrane protein, putative [Bodo saltans]|eukprot:CUE71635.1 transmembrane protein, putative [Bodo saltans]
MILNILFFALALHSTLANSSANLTLFSGTLVFGFAANATHLTTAMTVTGDYAGSFGVSTGGMRGPVVSCYVSPANASSAVCTDVDANYGVARAAAQVSLLVSAAANVSSWTVVVETPLTRLALTPGAVTSMMFAYTGWVAATALPTRHASNAKVLANVTVPGNAPPASTTVAPTPTPTPTPTTTPLPSTSDGEQVYSVAMSRALGSLIAELSFNSTAFWGTLTIAGGYVGTIGVVSSGMDGSMVACYGGNGNAGTATCFDVDGHQGYLVRSSGYTTLLSSQVNATHAVLSFYSPRSRFPYLGVESYIAYCWTPYDPATQLPVKHNIDQDHGAPLVNFATGAITEVTTPFTSRSQAYMIVGIVLGALLVVTTLLVRVAGVKLNPSHTVALQLSFVLLMWAMVAVVIVLAKEDFEVGMTLKPVFRAFGEATAFVLSIILIPTTKHVGLGVVIGSSYERMLFMHPLLGFTVLVTMTVPCSRCTRIPLTCSKRARTCSVLVTWLMMLCVVLPAMFLRRKYYNLFRATHFIFILVLVFGVLHHEELLVMLIPSFALWVIDIALRVRSAASAKAQLLELHYHDRAQILTLRMSVRWSAAPRPGSYAFLLIPSLSPVMHPFTVALAEEVDNHDRSRRVVTFFIKNNGGSTFTAKLANYAKQSLAPEALSLSLFGPHGNLQVPLDECNHVVLVCGGIGVTPMLSHALYFRAHRDEHRQPRQTSGDHVHLGCARLIRLRRAHGNN